jgi:hypothetical protein
MFYPGPFDGNMQVSLPVPPPPPLQPHFADMQTTVYVSNICNRIPDESVKDVLDTCGQVTKWNRQPDPVTGKLPHFGFCEFKKLEGAWRAVELLNGRQLGSHKLVVKADSKVKERIAEYPITQRVIPENESRIRATIEALVSRINSNWRDEAIARDAEIQDNDAPRQKPPVGAKALNVPASSEDALPHWYRDSRKEADRIRSIERRKRDRRAAFERALRKWEHEEQRIFRDLQRENEDPEIVAERKKRLIERDRGDERVVSGFTPEERQREIEADERDRIAEEKEIEQKRQKNEEELADLSKRLDDFSEGREISLPSDYSIVSEEGLGKVDSKLQTAVRKIPLTTDAVSRVQIDWSKVLTEGIMLKLRFWLRNKLKRFGCSEEESQTLSSFVVKSIETGAHSLGAVSDCLRRLKRLKEDVVVELGKKCFQLLFFSQLVQ